MKTLLTLTLITLLTITASAQVVNLNEPDKVYTEIPHTYTANGYAWARYHLRTHAHYVEGWRQADTMPVCDDGYTVANVAWTLADDVAVVTWDCEPIPPTPLYDASQWELSWPLLADHPATNDIPEGGMAYRLDGDPITWWVVRQGDLESTQISAHDDAGEPIYRSRNLATGTERTIHVGQLERAANMALAPLLADLTDEEVLERISVFPEWRAGVAVTVGEHFRYDGKAYRVAQAHTTQADWTPNTVPALFVEVAPPDTIPDWVQPTGAHDTYQIGDQVRFEGQVWESTINDNSWSPTVYPQGWKEVQ